MIQLHTTRNFLIEQQSTEMDNAISAVGMALAPYLEANDKVSAESVINATFDSSFYSEVTLSILHDEAEIKRTFPSKTTEVPDWFSRLIVIDTITKSSTLTSGWMQLANLTVTSSSTRAYSQLWQASMQLVFGFAVTFLFGLVFLALILSAVLKPLKLIQLRAKAMSNNQFGEPLPIPRIRELSDVVHAFNHMSSQLKVHFEQQAQEADNLRIRAYQDPVSGLANRSYLMTQLTSWLSTSQEGGIALLKVDLIADAYAQDGYETGDHLVQILAAKINILATEHYTIARLSQSEFMLLAPRITAAELKTIGQIMLQITFELQSDPLNIAPTQAAVGLVMRNIDDNMSTLLAQADNALTQAKQHPQEPLVLFDIAANTTKTRQTTMGKQQWKSLVDEAIANKLFKFTFQKAIDQNNKILHQEVFAYIQKGNQRYSAGQFLGAIEELNVGKYMDMHIIEELFNMLSNDKSAGNVAINITQSSVNDTGFMRWLANKMQSTPQLKERILFELPEICFIKNSDNTGLLCEIINKNNFSFGIDNFGHNFSSISYLNKFRPAYVKLDFAYTNQIDNQVKADVLASITRTANNLSITTIATRIETSSQQEKLSKLMIRGFQGYAVDKMNNEKSI
ncbi:MAG: EAL domain-containing protein [Moritella sp.]|uniref:bifunctional diguanylate cyclase/phosphodiesterase n=1 Tax=Moritella sp. TaxID=78556 RepID=UPI0029A959E9|nr:EAL domain-containing protein [Moritella sp.]MDX2319413.1 EAL domain-containing protein [Moritella sp.]